MQCPKCEKGLVARAKRKGWLETQILWRLGRYPWECNMCRQRMLLSLRDEPKVKPSPIWMG